MQHEGISSLSFKGINNLRIAGRAQRHCANSLRLTAGEKRRTVSFGKNIHF